ncbi:MAG TPA: L,D-transpeptidase family protein [Stellaceae bacterium]|nr:L,D-transpeptidase family protein [Stellaceae bacterium]
MHRHIAIAFLGLAAILVAGPGRSEGLDKAPTPVAARIRALLDTTADQDASSSGSSLTHFYAARHDEPAWSDPARVAALTSSLAAASDHGLEASFPKAALSAGDDPAARDVALTRLALAYATALASGRVAPSNLETDWAIPAPGFDAATGLATALTHDLGAWFDGLAPHHPQYRRLMTALARYRGIAEGGGWATISRGDPLKLGMIDPRVHVLRKRLEAEGDLRPQAAPPAPAADGAGPIRRVAAVVGGTDAPPPADAAPPADDPDAVYDAAVETAVRRFQRRNGIAVDGAVGPRTLAAMNLTVRARVEQIELNLERWRALPHDLGASYMMVNVPSETLDIVDQSASVMAMKVVVGDLGHPTPVVRTTMIGVTFNPFWKIPASIMTKEILPKSKRDHAYLAKNDIVFASGQGWEQLPGPKNPLGQLKFESPNQFDVYLHDTPSRVAFKRFFRAQSHGCVRLERAADLAGLVLRDAGWDPQQISEAVATGANRRVDLKRRWRVYILYATSFVDDDGTVEFRDDLYGRDGRLRAALAALHAARKPTL